MNKKELIKEISKRNGYSRKRTEQVINSLCRIIEEELKAGGKVRISGLGCFEVRERAARTGKNPKTGKMVEIKSGKVPVFRVGKTLKDRVN